MGVSTEKTCPGDYDTAQGTIFQMGLKVIYLPAIYKILGLV